MSGKPPQVSSREVSRIVAIGHDHDIFGLHFAGNGKKLHASTAEEAP